MKRLFNLIALLLFFLFSGCIISQSPSTNPVVLEPCQTQAFSIVALGNITQWYLDDVEIPGATLKSFSFTNCDAGEYTLKVVEQGGGMSEFREWTVIVNNKPTITGTPDITVEQDTAYTFTPTANDLDGDPLTFTIKNQPNWTNFNSNTGALSGTCPSSGMAC